MTKTILPIRPFVRISTTTPNATPNRAMNSVMNTAITTNATAPAQNANSTDMQRNYSGVAPRRTTHFSPCFRLFCSFFCPTICAAVFTSCSEAQIDLEAITTPPEAVTIANDLVTIPQGIAVAVRVHTDASSTPESSGPYISMTSADPAIISVWPTTRESVFVLGGASPGVAAFSVSIQGDSKRTFTATVVPNPNATKSRDNNVDENANGQNPLDNQTPDENASNSQALTQPLAPCTQP